MNDVGEHVATTGDDEAVQATPPSRIEGLDAWRAILMLTGILLHATLAREPHPAFEIVEFVSTMFRMGAFFAISGLLAAVSLSKRPAGVWYRSRVVQIGIPTLFALVAICPLTGLIFRAAPVGLMAAPPLAFDWYHIWFLVALLLYTPMAAMLHRSDARHALFARIDRALPPHGRIQAIALVGIPLVSLLGMTFAVRLLAYAPAGYWTPLSQCRLILAYVPLYLMGFAIARSAVVREALLERRTIAPVVLIGFGGVYLLARFAMPAFGVPPSATLITYTLHIGSAFCPPAAAILILRSAIAIPRISPLVRRWAAAALTVYIVHFPIVTAINIALAYVAWPVAFEYALAVGLGAYLSYLVHVGVVERWPVAALLLNGRTGPGGALFGRAARTA